MRLASSGFASRAEPAPAARHPFDRLSRGQVVGTLIGVMLALLLAALDQTIVGTAMPRIVAELQGLQHYAWVTTAYLLSSTVVVPIVGKLSDLYGRKRFLTSGVVLFVAASALCGAAQDMLQLAAFRGLQGIGAGFLMSMAFASVGDLFPPARRGRIQGVFAALFGLASVLGPLVGGYITDHWSWRWVFYVNLPVGLLALGALLALYPLVRPARRRPVVDYAGAGVLVLAAVPLLLALSWGGTEYPWDSVLIRALLGFGLAMTGVLLWVERRAPEPIIPLDLFQNAIVRVSVLALVLMTSAMFGSILFIPLFVQGVIGTSATVSGTVLTPMMIAMTVSSIASGQFITRTGRYRAVALGGLGIMTLGMLLLTTMGPDTTNLAAVRNMVVIGVGLGACMPIFTLVVQNVVPYSQLGAATALTQFARAIGGTLGVAGFGSLLANRYPRAFYEALPPALQAAISPASLASLENPQALFRPEGAEQLRQQLAQLGLLDPALAGQVFEALRLGLAAALHDVFALATVVVFAAWLSVLFLREIPLRSSYTAVPQPAPGEQAAPLAPAGMEQPAARPQHDPVARPDPDASRR
jgi:EmrB/QacA subfamily drug resistance transporter